MDQPENPEGKPSYAIGQEHVGNPTVKPYQIIKINLNDLVQKFNNTVGNQVSPLIRGGILRAYKQGLQDAQYLLMAAEKDGELE